MKDNKFVINTGISIRDFEINNEKYLEDLLLLVNEFFKDWDRIKKEPGVIEYYADKQCFVMGKVKYSYYSIATLRSLNNEIILIYNIENPEIAYEPLKGFSIEEVHERRKEILDFENKAYGRL
ncbi:hypothetical protein HX039_18140 [Myroides marinus]|uniref:hypothetical protein n=1 Tax=Myroides marinus TaxID=703342 RepID=UPI0025755397|nr:hypothetical protein [Myroides marinus]MDM1405997.1 hypothetical protein [Myroides marinus]